MKFDRKRALTARSLTKICAHGADFGVEADFRDLEPVSRRKH